MANPTTGTGRRRWEETVILNYNRFRCTIVVLYACMWERGEYLSIRNNIL